ncbi:MAG TPA: hypothetical protein VGR98_12205 [Streptosporangiaceae bacterium]|nr:hypothetical protein [Streptosporangiaceae bacterium]
MVEAVAAGTGASVSVAVLARRWFRAAVREVVDERVDDLERRVADHLNRQDVRLIRIESRLERNKR